MHVNPEMDLDECGQGEQEDVLQVKTLHNAHWPVRLPMKGAIPVAVATDFGWYKPDSKCGNGYHQTEYERQSPSEDGQENIIESDIP